MNENSMRVKYPSDEDIVVLSSIDLSNKHRAIIYMTKFSEHDKELFENDEFFITIGNEKYCVDKSNCYLYGNVNLNDQEDIDAFRDCNFKWCNELGHGSFIPRNYDYKENTGDLIYSGIMQDVLMPATVETFDNLEMYKFGHAKLGKPKEVIIFKKIVIKADLL